MARNLSLLLFLAGVACIIAGIATGQGEVGIFIIFPFVAGSGWLLLLGVMLLFLSLLALLFTGVPREEGIQVPLGRYRDGQTEKKMGGLILIGPLPIVIASDRTLALVLLLLGVVLAVTFFVVLPALW